jgi:hypothetical protein
MPLERIANIAEISAAVLVIVSLIYVGIQIRQNTKTVRGSTLQRNTDFWGTLFLRLAEPEVVRAYGAGLAGQPDIRPVHYTQFFFICRAMFLGLENQYYQFRQGILDDATYLGYERSIQTQLLAFPGFRIWWQQSRSVFSPVFVTHIDSMIERTPEADPRALLSEWSTLAKRAGILVSDTKN